jgi:hypothetical protein
MPLTGRFIRFVISRPDPDSSVAQGVFAIAYQLRDSSDIGPADRETLLRNLKWFEDNLQTPSRFNRTKSKGFYRRRARGIAWFRDTATEHLARMHLIKCVLERHGHCVVMVSESRVGYVTYEDAFQVVAEPFADTQTG